MFCHLNYIWLQNQHVLKQEFNVTCVCVCVCVEAALQLSQFYFYHFVFVLYVVYLCFAFVLLTSRVNNISIIIYTVNSNVQYQKL